MLVDDDEEGDEDDKEGTIDEGAGDEEQSR